MCMHLLLKYFLKPCNSTIEVTLLPAGTVFLDCGEKVFLACFLSVADEEGVFFVGKMSESSGTG